MTDMLHRAVFALVVLLALSGCARLLESVDTTYNRSVDFAALETYRWQALHGTEATDEGELALIRRLVDTDLQGKGLRAVEAEPDFLVVVVLSRARQVESQEIHRSIPGDRRHITSPPVGENGSGPAYWAYEEGTMVIHFVRPQTNHMVWRGTFKTDLDSATTPKKRAAVIERAVRKIMKAFPPS
ncbi:MAG: DUF4136 domain-containing protein [Desulfobacterales bacterium]|nr:DUF4136 domain-containing protein [Desulfobacterales bacterium]MDJ0889037.1 DUF4136 domain-containing protein [Desulfobacterales bacterium]